LSARAFGAGLTYRFNCIARRADCRHTPLGIAEVFAHPALDAPTLGRPERAVAGCLKGDAESDKIQTIDLAKKRLADAQEWRALGIF
jgi:hypothetical protein